MEETGDITSKIKLPVGLTVSFGVVQRALDVAILSGWAKDFQTGTDSDDPVIHQDVCKLMNQGFDRLGVPAYVNCVLNDTTGTLIAAGMEKDPRKPQCLVGFIIGTGLNGCYFEPEAKTYGYHGNIINTEVGGFSRNLPICIADVEVDADSANKGHQQLEKLVSGLYIPEIIRLLILRCLEDDAPTKAWERNSLTTSSVAAIFTQDEGETDMAQRVMESEWGWTSNHKNLLVTKDIVDAVFDRSAACSAAVIAALAKKTRRLQPAMGGVTVGIDGSLYRKIPKYQTRVKFYLTSLLGEELAALINFRISEDGSGKGAAYLAATISNSSS